MPPKVESPTGELNIDMAPESDTVSETAPATPDMGPATDSAADRAESGGGIAQSTGKQPGSGAAAIDIPAAPPRPRSPQRPTGPITVPPKLRPVMPKRRGMLRPILFLIAGLLIGLLGAVYYFRAEIARAVPAFDMAYSLMGISTSNPAKDLDIGNLVFNRRNTDGVAVVSIQGDIFNKSQFPVRLPHLVAIPSAKDEAGQDLVLEPWHPFRLEQDVIEPGETITFRTFFENLPKGTKSLKVTFLE